MAKSMICTACGTTAAPKQVTKGSLLIEFILWCCFLVPGLLYSIWRHTSRFNACPKCKSPHIVPLDSPIGKKLHSEMS